LVNGPQDIDVGRTTAINCVELYLVILVIVRGRIVRLQVLEHNNIVVDLSLSVKLV
jgi:hypothetical protein